MLDTEKKEGRNRVALQSPNKVTSEKHNADTSYKEKRLSAATRARIEQKQLIQQMLLNSSSNLSPKRKNISSRKVSSASAQTYSQRRRTVKSKSVERPKSSTPRVGRQRGNLSKNNG